MVEKIKSIINCDAVGQAFYNLFDRWQDESEYEDINDYGKAIVSTINKNFPNYGATLVKATKEPFGVILQIGAAKFHVFVKLKNLYLHLCAKPA